MKSCRTLSWPEIYLANVMALPAAAVRHTPAAVACNALVGGGSDVTLFRMTIKARVLAGRKDTSAVKGTGLTRRCSPRSLNMPLAGTAYSRGANGVITIAARPKRNNRFRPRADG